MALPAADFSKTLTAPGVEQDPSYSSLITLAESSFTYTPCSSQVVATCMTKYLSRFEDWGLWLAIAERWRCSYAAINLNIAARAWLYYSTIGSDMPGFRWITIVAW